MRLEDLVVAAKILPRGHLHLEVLLSWVSSLGTHTVSEVFAADF